MNISQSLIFQKLLGLNLNPADYAVFGSGPMFAHGIRPIEELSDLDLIVTTKGLAKLCTVPGAVVEYDDLWECFHLRFIDDPEIEAYSGWGPGRYNPDEIITNADVIGGVRFVKLETVREWKLEMGREKDLIHIKQIDEFLSRTNDPEKEE
jgi:hypothetical protein